MITQTNAKPHGRWVFWWFAAFFGVIFAANGVLIWLATSSLPGVVSGNAYEQGLAYNRTIAADEAQKALGWTHTLSLLPARGKTQTLQLVLQDAGKHPIVGANITAYMVRPTSKGKDFQTAMTTGATPGTYRADMVFPLPGQWDVRIVANAKGQSYQAHKRLVIP